MDISHLATILREKKCSCVVWNGENISLYHDRGVKDLYLLLTTQPSVLEGAMIADKVVGKGAAALMILGKVRTVYADVISQAALSLFEQAHTEISYGRLVPNIINRAATGICPVEALCMQCHTAEECLPLISQFLKDKK